MELQQFLDKYKFAQRNLHDGTEQPVNYTHQPLDILHEEIIRLELMCLDKNRLKKNSETDRMERDPEVFTQACRWLGYFGEDFVTNSEHNREKRRYQKFFKQVLLIRSHLRKKGFVADYKNPKLPFFSLDLTTEMHPELHNFKLVGDQNFRDALEHLSLGNAYTSLPCRVQPKTLEEEEKITKRNELSKEELHKKAIRTIKVVLESKVDDQFLQNSLEILQNKKPHSFNPKQTLTELCSRIEQYTEDLMIQDRLSELQSIVEDGNNDDDGNSEDLDRSASSDQLVGPLCNPLLF